MRSENRTHSCFLHSCLQVPGCGSVRKHQHLYCVLHLSSVSNIIARLSSQLLPRRLFSWKVPKAFSAPRHHPLSHFHPVFFSFLLFFLSSLFWEGSIWGCSLEGERNTTATDTSDSIVTEQRHEHGSLKGEQVCECVPCAPWSRAGRSFRSSVKAPPVLSSHATYMSRASAECQRDQLSAGV